MAAASPAIAANQSFEQILLKVNADGSQVRLKDVATAGGTGAAVGRLVLDQNDVERRETQSKRERKAPRPWLGTVRTTTIVVFFLVVVVVHHRMPPKPSWEIRAQPRQRTCEKPHISVAALRVRRQRPAAGSAPNPETKSLSPP